MRIVFLADFRFWAFDSIAKSIKSRLTGLHQIEIKYSSDQPILDPAKIDLLYVFFWGETWYQNFSFEKKQIIKEVASWRWRDDDRWGRLDGEEFYSTYLHDCAYVTTPCLSLYHELRQWGSNIIHAPNGVEWRFFSRACRQKPQLIQSCLSVGWIGNRNDSCKGLADYVIPAASQYSLKIAGGNLTKSQLLEFYRSIDVVIIASSSESQPLPLLEGLAAGCFIVSTNVGIVPELLQESPFGMICEREVNCIMQALACCHESLAYLRETRGKRSRFAMHEDWDFYVPRFNKLFNCVKKQKTECSRALPPLNRLTWPRETAKLTTMNNFEFKLFFLLEIITRIAFYLHPNRLLRRIQDRINRSPRLRSLLYPVAQSNPK